MRVLNVTPCLLYPTGRRANTNCIGGWVGLRPDLDGRENPPPHWWWRRCLTPDHPVHNKLLY